MRLKRRAKNSLRGFAAVTLALATMIALIGVTYEATGNYQDQRRFPLKGSLVSVDGHRMHLVCTGHGEPPVILEAPFTGLSAAWAPVQSTVSRFTRVCSYDRAGYGWSEPGPQPRTSERIATELHSLLAAAQVHSPYLLVGASAGGFHVRVFAGHFPAEVAAMVLVDSSHPDQAARLHLDENPTGTEEEWEPFLPVAHAFGILRFGLHREPRPPAFPADAWDEMLYLREKTNSYRTLLREGEAWAQSADEVRASANLGSRALVMTGGRGPNTSWLGLQADLVHLSSRGKQVMVAGSGHGIQFEEPDAVVNGIRDTWNALK